MLNITTYDRDVNSSLRVSAPDTITCYILPSFGAEHFALSDCENFFAKDVVDIDSHLEFRTLNLTIMVNDSFGYSDTATVIIEVQDENDNAPVFKSSAYSASIPGKLYAVYFSFTQKNFLFKLVSTINMQLKCNHSFIKFGY